jgi:hypothetical protein
VKADGVQGGSGDDYWRLEAELDLSSDKLQIAVPLVPALSTFLGKKWWSITPLMEDTNGPVFHRDLDRMVRFKGGTGGHTEVYRCGPKVKPFLLITVSDPLELRAVLNRLFKIPEDAGIPAAPVDVPSKRLRIGNLKDKEESASEDSDDDDDE